jgi:hypothetical protein
MFQTLIVLSQEPDIRCVLSFEMIKLETHSGCPDKVLRHSPDSVDQISVVVSFSVVRSFSVTIRMDANSHILGFS